MRFALIFTDKNYMKFKDQLISPNLKLKHIVGLPKLPRVLKYKKKKKKSTIIEQRWSVIGRTFQGLWTESGEKFDIAEWPIHTCHIAPDCPVSHSCPMPGFNSTLR